MLQNKDIIIQKARKGSSTVVVIDKELYKKNQKLSVQIIQNLKNVQEEKHKNFILNKGKKIIRIVKLGNY